MHNKKSQNLVKGFGFFIILFYLTMETAGVRPPPFKNAVIPVFTRVSTYPLKSLTTVLTRFIKIAYGDKNYLFKKILLLNCIYDIFVLRLNVFLLYNKSLILSKLFIEVKSLSNEAVVYRTVENYRLRNNSIQNTLHNFSFLLNSFVHFLLFLLG